MSDNSLIICGGGLWGGLLSYRLNQLNPAKTLKLYEKQAFLGGNHTWSFHESDVSKEALEWLKPFIVKSWEGYKVKFPAYERSFKGRYHSITSEKFHEVILKAVGNDKIRLSQECPEREFVDARGTYPYEDEVGYQKFVGLHIKLNKPHNLKEPILMDSTIEQKDGFRFIYYLPFNETELLIEDTYYSTSSDLDIEKLKLSLEEIIINNGWCIEKIIRQEDGVLPLPYSFSHLENITSNSLAGLFHDVTGYSFPDAIRLIELITREANPNIESISAIIAEYKEARRGNRKYFQLLNRMMFKAAVPHHRYRVLEHFYKLPQPLIERFYRGEINTQDKFRILMGKPPVPVVKAIKSIMELNSRRI